MQEGEDPKMVPQEEEGPDLNLVVPGSGVGPTAVHNNTHKKGMESPALLDSNFQTDPKVDSDALVNTML